MANVSFSLEFYLETQRQTNYRQNLGLESENLLFRITILPTYTHVPLEKLFISSVSKAFQHANE